MRKTLLLFLVLSAVVWAQPGEPGSEAPAGNEETAEVTEQQTETVEETI